MCANKLYFRVIDIAKKNYEKVEIINETKDSLFSLQR